MLELNLIGYAKDLKMEPTSYECNECDYWEITHGGKDDDPERHKKCQRCTKKLRIYRDWIEKDKP